MSYTPPFQVVKSRLLKYTTRGNVEASVQHVKVAYDELLEVIKLLLRGIDVDEAWYREQYPDVGQAIAEGVYRSAKHHFVEYGYFEGRWPSQPAIDEAWYLEQYPDVAERVEAGDVASALDHFRDHGYSEGRLPAEY